MSVALSEVHIKREGKIERTALFWVIIQSTGKISRHNTGLWAYYLMLMLWSVSNLN
jgi:hypothetical protein